MPADNAVNITCSDFVGHTKFCKILPDLLNSNENITVSKEVICRCTIRQQIDEHLNGDSE